MFNLISVFLLLLLVLVATRAPVKRRFLDWLFPTQADEETHWTISEMLDELDNVAFQRVIDYYHQHQAAMIVEALPLGYNSTSDEEMFYFTLLYLRVNRLADV